MLPTGFLSTPAPSMHPMFASPPRVLTAYHHAYGGYYHSYHNGVFDGGPLTWLILSVVALVALPFIAGCIE